MTATKTKPRPVPTVERHGRALDRRYDEYAAFQSLKDQLEGENDDLQDAPLFMSSAQVAVFEDNGVKGRAAIVGELRRHRRTRLIREIAGDPATLAAARVALEKAIEAEQTTRAVLSDLDADSEGEPILAKQARQIAKQLAELTAARVAAEAKVAQLESQRAWLRKAAPEPLRRDAERALAREEFVSPCKRRLGKLRAEIGYLEKVLNHWDAHQLWAAESGTFRHIEKDDVFCGHARIHLPAAYTHNNGCPSIDRRLFAEHVETLRNETLPALIAEQTKLKAEWQAIVDEIESQLDHWMLTGEVLR